ncbi:hypothetical protein DMENIID0001_083320 [Sergentomyia squamirostris]
MSPKRKNRAIGGGVIPVEKQEENGYQSILILNDDCLLAIFSYLNLRTLRTIVALDKLCTRFSNVAESIYKRQKELIFDQYKHELPISRNEMNNIAQRVGRYVRSLKINGRHYENPNVLQPLLFRLNKLEHLHIEKFKIMEHAKILKKAFKTLKTLKLIDCDVPDEISPFLKAAPQLESLSLAKNYEIEGSFLHDMKHLKEIDLSICPFLTRSNFINFCTDNHTLRRLDIFDWEDLNQRCIQAIVDGLKNLDGIGIGKYNDIYETDFDFECLANLPKLTHLALMTEAAPYIKPFLKRLSTSLKYLDISTDFTMMDETVMGVVECEKLKVLKIHYIHDGNLKMLTEKLACKNTLECFEIFGAPPVSDEAVFEFVQKCPQLKRLNLQECENITDDLIMNLATYLGNRDFEICLARTYCTKSLDEKLSLLENCKVHLNWKYKCEIYAEIDTDHDDSDNCTPGSPDSKKNKRQFFRL